MACVWNNGPSIEQRREFAGLKNGTQVPGYGGYIPQIIFHAGKTYGKQTEQLSSQPPFRKSHTQDQSTKIDRILMNIPMPSGSNKYTINMVPGYTGYIPHSKFFYGKSYKESCDSCIGEHTCEFHNNKQEQASLCHKVNSSVRLEPINSNPNVKHQLERYRHSYPEKNFLTDKREFHEPPIPGYLGYIPRTYTTDVGVGVKYNQMTKRALSLFQEEQKRDMDIQNGTFNRDVSVRSAPSFSNRLYNPTGMVPKYTGYIPQRRFTDGQTYGETTRRLDVCAHDLPCFGDYAKKHMKILT